MPPTTLTCTLRRPDRKCSISQAGASYRRSLIGETDTADATEYEVKQLLPSVSGYDLEIGDAHPQDSTAKLRSIDLEPRDETRKHWDIELFYEPATIYGSTSIPPLDRPVEIRWGSEEVMEIAYADADGTPYTNSAGEPFNPQPQRPKCYLTCTYTRNEADPTWTDLVDFQNVINDASITVDGKVFAAKQALLRITDAPKITEGATTYYRVTYYFRFKGVNWNPTEVLDVGLNQKSGANLVPILDADGSPVRRPWPLNGAGVKMTNPDDAPAILEFNDYPVADFSTLAFS